MSNDTGLRPINPIGVSALWRWLGGGWSDLWSAPATFLPLGLVFALIGAGLIYAVAVTNAAFWSLVLICGFVFVAPMLAMGFYEGGRLIEQGKKPRLGDVVLVRSAIRSDLAYLGLFLLLIFLLWGRIAQIVYGLSTYTLHTTIPDFIAFAVGTQEGRGMLLTGSIVGGVIALFTYGLVVVSAPMLLARNTNVFAASLTSLRSVATNFAPMMLWAVIILVLTLSTAVTAFVALIVVFPWLGLASWRAYRDLVG